MRHAVHSLAAALILAAAPAHAQPTDATALSGEWNGTYECAQGTTTLELALRGNAHGVVRGTFAFGPTPQNPDVLTGSYPVLGRLAGTALMLRPIDVRDMPGSYLPVGILATVEGDRITGWIEGPTCGAIAVRRTSTALSTDPLHGGYGAQAWTPIGESEQGVLSVDARERRGSGASTASVWLRWHSPVDAPQMGLSAGQAAEWEVEYDCDARLVRTWHTLVYDADGQLRHVDANAPYAWAPLAEGSLDEVARDHVCSGALLST